MVGWPKRPEGSGYERAFLEAFKICVLNKEIALPLAKTIDKETSTGKFVDADNFDFNEAKMNYQQFKQFHNWFFYWNPYGSPLSFV